MAMMKMNRMWSLLGLGVLGFLVLSCGNPTSTQAENGGPLETAEPNGRDQKPAFPEQTRAPALTTDMAVTVETVAKGLEYPWGFEFLPDGRILVTEKPGRLRIIAADGSLSKPAVGVPAVSDDGQGGLLDVALAPDYADSGVIYFSFSEPVDGKTRTALAKAKLLLDGDAPRLMNVTVLFRQEPALKPKHHYGSRIVFTGDGKLFLTMGDRGNGHLAQDLSTHVGKIVRLNLDGSVPEDNPFVGQKDARPEIWSYGHRNVQGAVLDEASQQLWTVEHGARGGDELNHPQAGKNYGWQVITYGIDYSGRPIGDGITAKEGMEQPVYYWDPSYAPSGLLLYTGDLFPDWKGNLFVGTLAGMRLVRLKLEDGKVTGEGWLLQDQEERIRDVKQGPDGAIYVATDSDEGRILRLSPKK